MASLGDSHYDTQQYIPAEYIAVGDTHLGNPDATLRDLAELVASLVTTLQSAGLIGEVPTIQMHGDMVEGLTRRSEERAHQYKIDWRKKGHPLPEPSQKEETDVQIL